MAEYTDREKMEQATKAHIDAGVLTLFDAFMRMHAMQELNNKLINRVLKLETKLEEVHGELATRIDALDGLEGRVSTLMETYNHGG
jgi:hypothetical protein